MPGLKSAFLVLDDGRIFEGQSWAAEGESFGEAVFTTRMTGYQETLTNPSYHKQSVVMTAPHIGNTGFNPEDYESDDEEEDKWDNMAKACWSGYKQVGMKDKNGKKVPNCVPIKKSMFGTEGPQELIPNQKK